MNTKHRNIKNHQNKTKKGVFIPKEPKNDD